MSSYNVKIMVIENQIPKTEMVYEIKKEIPSFEEFMESYEVDKKVGESYDIEFDSYGDLRIDRSYGPGNNQLINEEELNKLARYMGKYLASKGINKAFGPISLSVGEILKVASGRSRPFPERLISSSSLGLSEAAENSPSSESKEENEFMKWMGDLGNDLAGSWDLGMEEIAQDIASGADSEATKKFWGIIDKSLEAYGVWKDAEVHLALFSPQQRNKLRFWLQSV